MAGTFQLELVSPARLLLSRPVEMAVIPAAEGEMGVLPGHAPMIVALRGGVISVTEGGQVTEHLFVNGGFAEITPERVTVLADDATPVANLSKAAAATALAQAEAGMVDLQSSTPEKRDQAMVALLSAQAMVATAEAP
ncbi:ATP synthase F1 subunit epsilon [Plastoroseomonas arctica]|uniref:ATP synthase epsilon chain n=1 Tax=Plastoroseomonas arctica TaxID=1509237 RepID=A0AAF1KIS8_9PROT|nr:ATP synthase F1 subunit epsilon [Plastoroseomonas arctica]MBR0654420.1 ATP synthase F1 subunit epsilon [Plastoroseomonas arctica]